MNSYLPAGVTSREIDALCEQPHWTHEYIFECAKCLQEIYDESLPKFRINGQLFCFGCAHACAMCGKWLDDDAFPAKVYEICFREYENDGKLSDAHCPQCAASWLIGVFIGDLTFDYDDYPGEWGKDAIAQLLAKAFPLPAKEVSDAA